MTEPLFRVVYGNPSGEETAALAVVLAAKLAARPAEDRARERSSVGRWADRARSMRAPLTPGLGAWRRSGQPR
jgi:Acyl-CoA carboxylase epsilon subunit